MNAYNSNKNLTLLEKNPEFSIDNAKRLYEAGMEMLNQRKEKEKKELDRLNEMYTFKPEIHQKYKFTSNHLDKPTYSIRIL